ncbi:MAG TPA: hypothetical protein VF017_01885 [Thermoanaerobaculia bacterium]|nr:hypothetical protein [Thermoanaerobaculia bacterium]
MKDQPWNPEEIERWLLAEAAEDDSLAEAKLAALFAEVPRESPAPGFADRVLAGLARETAAQRRAWWRSRWFQGLSVSLVLAAGLSLVLGPWLLPPLFERLGWSELGLTGLMAVLADGVQGLGRFTTELALLTERLDRFSSYIFATTQTPGAAAAALVLLACGAFALKMAHTLVGGRRRSHAQS